MAYDFDPGDTGSQGPWINWTARGTQDGSVPALSFVIRDEGGPKAFDAMKKGVLFDLNQMRTGWRHSEGGGRPDWVWNASPARMQAQPDDRKWKKGFQVPVIYKNHFGKIATATFEDAAVGSWLGWSKIAQQLSAQSRENPGKLPVIKQNGVEQKKFTNGSTAVPLFEIVKWVDRPTDAADADAAPAPTARASQSSAPAQRAPASQSAAQAATAFQAPSGFHTTPPDGGARETGMFSDLDDEIPF